MRALARRLGVYLLAAWVAITVSFLLPRVVPGNPVAGAIARAQSSGICNQYCIKAIEEQLGFNVHVSLGAQYVQYLGNLVHGNLGFSWSENAPVTSLIASYLPWTLGLLGVATIVSFLAGTVIGVVMAWRRGSGLDWLLPAATFFQAIPYFFLALVLVLIFGETGSLLKWFPSLYGYDIYGVDPGMNLPYIGSIIGHAVLPALTVILASMGGFILSMRNQMITTMDEDFVLVARAKGLRTGKVVWYAARNALLPCVSNFSVAISLVVAGQILVEIVFNYPGIGYHLYGALGALDYTLVQGIFVVITLVVLAANLLADVVYVLIDPRARQEAWAMTINTPILGEPGTTASAAAPSRVLRLPRSPKVIAGLVILAVFAVIAVIGTWIAPYSPNLTNESWVQHVLVAGTGPGTHIPADYYPLPLPPSSAHWLGTTVFAQDVWSQLLASTQATVAVGLLAAALSTVLSIIVGVTAGYLGGGADEGLSLIGNVFLAIPGLPLLIVLADYVPAAGTSIFLVSLIIAITAWAYSSRVLRAQTLSLRNRDFVEAARVSGEGRIRIILVEVLPNLIPIVAASFLFTTLYAIGAYVAISFLGLAGSPTSSPPGLWNWGYMLREVFANDAVRGGWWWWWAPPGLCIALLGTGLALLNFGIDEFINPRLRVVGLSRKAARSLGISRRPKLGLTPVVRRNGINVDVTSAEPGTP